MNKLLTSLLLAATLATPAFATDAAKPAATAPAAAPAEVKAPAVGEAVTPQNDKAAMKEIIAKMKHDSQAAKAKAAEKK